MVDANMPLAKAGEVASKIYLLVSGLMRVYLSDEAGKEYNKNFFIPLCFVGSYTSLIKNEPSKLTYETLTECKLYEIDFKELKNFIIESKFDRLGIFTYSHEEDTPAYFLKDNIPEKIKQQRADEIMQIQQDISYQNNLKKVGNKFKILIDREEENYFIGRTEYDSPEVDNEVLIEKSENNCRIGEFYKTKITKADMFDLFGALI
mgnify:CR=1 FL=1